MSSLGDPQFAKELSQFTPLNALNPDNLLELSTKSKKLKINKNAVLFKAGQRDNYHFFLLNGSVELIGKSNAKTLIKAGTPEARTALAHEQPRAVTAVAASDASVIQINSELLDIMLTWDQTGSYEVRDLREEPVTADGSSDWMTQILQTKAFHRIPPANIQAMFMRLESVVYKAGDTVVRQDDDGDYFYLIKEGRCIVTRTIPGKAQTMQLAELGPGESFGEEALISDAKRNATVTMLTKGTMMRLSKADFMALLNEPLLNWIDFPSALEKIHNGATWIDVRLPSEYENAHVQNAINIPLIFLRMKMNSLDNQKIYIIYCDTGRRSSAAAFLLSERGYNVFLLKEGISSVPTESLQRGKTTPA